MMSNINSIKLFVYNALAIETELINLQKKLDTKLGHKEVKARETSNRLSSNFPAHLISEAEAMSDYYVSFYCLENYIRKLVEETLGESFSNQTKEAEDWWEEFIPDHLRNEAEKRRSTEQNAAMTLRSDNMLDYLNFGELSQVIEKNWHNGFETLFSDLAAVKRVLADLNRIRSPIAHCCVLPNDEVERLNLAIKDFVRLIQ